MREGKRTEVEKERKGGEREAADSVKNIFICCSGEVGERQPTQNIQLSSLLKWST